MTPSISQGKGHVVRGHLNADEKRQENEKHETTEGDGPLFAMKRKVIDCIQTFYVCLTLI